MKSKKALLYDMWIENNSLNIPKAALKIGLDESTAYSYVRQFKSKPKLTPRFNKSKKKISVDNPNLRTLTVSSLIDSERLDIKKIIREGISKIPSGQVAYDDNLRRDLQVAENRWREYSRDEEFESFRAILPTRKVVWGKKATIDHIKQMDGVT